MLILPRAKKAVVAGTTALNRVKKIVAAATMAVSLAFGGSALASELITDRTPYGTSTETGSLILAPPAAGGVLAGDASHASHASHESHASHASHYSSKK